MNKLLITGATGFLGRNILTVLKESDFQIMTLGNLSTDIVCDISCEIPNFNCNFDYVIHAAGKAHSVPKSESEKQEFYQVNIEGTKNLIAGFEKSNFLPKYFIFISSVSVYGLETGNNINEEHSLLAKDAYGLSKIGAEDLIKEWCGKNNVICTILRLPLLVGKNAPGNLGTMVKAIEKGYYFNIGGGKARKSMVLAKDVATFIPKVAVVGGTYNLTDGIDPSFNELSNAISKKNKTTLNLPLFVARIMGLLGNLLGDQSPINSFKLKKITSDLTFDDSKARTLLGWNPQSVIDYLKNNDI
ncbi:UDP-galactose-4-epimerase [Flavobacterium piscis]|uniref:UDP-galactose-4-epimerase n=1 Tax=Flavobacterium piscis TaxID=1114874 RepID=A0ABX2XEJ6_9FLAO|nr:NAD-dependent epimerase/dehydratase family protein [Flavobacterium piscis]OCB70570.1 UDP-galactose-4-epimerase [Flavobacterium piscis]OXG08592.1 UDP-galactose-4-epimerase [Flavobacterium piscis]